MTECLCKWIIGGMAIGIVSMAAYIAKWWKEKSSEDKKELDALREQLRIMNDDS